jgi:3-(3-hydroxy-phenyl)propionate hydroxylase
MSDSKDRVIVAGAGPVGLVAALALARRGIPTLVIEAEADLAMELRGSTFHPPTLDMLDEFGVVQRLIDEGIKAPTWQFRDRETGPVATFDLALIAGDTAHPYRVQCEQWKLTRLLREEYLKIAGTELRFGHRAVAARQDEGGIAVEAETRSGPVALEGRYLVAADGARSALRRSLGIEFEGFTYPEYFLIASTPFRFEEPIADLAYVNYISDPNEWLVLLRVRDLWRALVPAPETADRDQALSDESLEQVLQRVVARPVRYEIVHRSIYHVHQRVASRFRAGRALIAGDAAHINNPLGGMGMNGGIHDAFNLAEKLAAVWHGGDDRMLDRYDRQRRTVSVEAVQQQTMRNHQIMSERDPGMRKKSLDALRRIGADPALARDYMLKSSMIGGVRRAAEIA